MAERKFDVIQRPAYKPKLGGRPMTAIRVALEATAESGGAVRLALDGLTAEVVRRNLLQLAKHAGFGGRTMTDGDAIIAWFVKK